MSKKTTEFGSLCRQYRIALKISQIQAAEKIGVNQSDISKMENGEQSPSFDYIKKSIDLYQIKDRKKQMDFILSSLNSNKNIDIPMDSIGPLRKECLAAICTIGEIKLKNPDGWDNFIDWMDEFLSKIKSMKPKFTGLDEGSLI